MKFASILVGAVAVIAAAACGGGSSDEEAATLAFRGEVNPLGDYSYDTGLQPAGSPVQAQFLFASEAKLSVEAAAVPTDAPALASKPGSGKLTLSAKFLLQANLKVDVSGLKYDGEIPGLDAIDISFAGEAPFDPFALEAPVGVETSIPETKLPDIPLPGGLPGVLSLTIASGSVLSSSFKGSCVANDGERATYRGGSTTTGSVVIKPTIILRIPVVGDREFEIPSVTAPVPSLEAAVDLGTLDVTATGDAPAGAEVVERASCTDSAGRGDGGASSGGNGTSLTPDGGGPDASSPILACANNSLTVEELLENSYRSRLADRGSCTDAQLDLFEAAIANQGAAGVDALYESVPAGACRSCIFTELADDGTVPDSVAALGYLPGAGYVLNDGWCVANRVENPLCGKAFLAFIDCGRAVCADCGFYDPSTGESDADHEACLDEAYGTAGYVCRDEAGPNAREECGEGIDDAQTFCGQLTPLQAVRLLCGP